MPKRYYPPRGEVFQKMKVPEFKPLERTQGFRRGELEVYVSAPEVGYSVFLGKTESPKYTGTYVKGIATMHKSNAVPVVSQEEATDISNMRRN